MKQKAKKTPSKRDDRLEKLLKKENEDAWKYVGRTTKNFAKPLQNK